MLSVLKARDYEDAIRHRERQRVRAHRRVYYGNGKRRPARSSELQVGNLYINRKCTGALVGGHPFGGFDMSGTNAKAGGHDYLRLFLEAKVVSEKI